MHQPSQDVGDKGRTNSRKIWAVYWDTVKHNFLKIRKQEQKTKKMEKKETEKGRKKNKD